MHPSDEYLVSQVQQGDLVSFEALVKRYQIKLLHFTARYIKSPQDCEDIVAETFISLYKTIHRVDTKRKFSTYLFEIAKNRAFSFLRSFKKTISLARIEIESNEDNLKSLQDKWDRGRLQNALNQLDVKYRSVLTLYYFQDLSYEEIAKKTGIPLNTVRIHLKRGKEKMKKLLLTRD